MRRLFVIGICLALGLPASALAANTAWVSSNHIQVVDLDAGQVVGRIALREFIHDMEFSRDGSLAYVASSKGLRVADADKLQFVQKVDGRPTSSLSSSNDGLRLAALHRADSESSQAARLAGLPLPPSHVVVYSTQGMSVEATFPVSGNALDVVADADGDTIYVLVPKEGAVYAHSLEGEVTDTFQIVDQAGTHGAMLSRLALAPSGDRLVLSVTDAEQSWVADIDLSGGRQGTERVLRQDLGHAHRVQGLSWDEDGSGVYVSSVGSVVKFNKLGLPVQGQQFPVNYVDVRAIPGTDQTVMVTPTFSKARSSGGVSVVGANGAVLRSIELPDMSPFVVIVRP